MHVDENTESFRNETVTIESHDSNEYEITGEGGQLAQHTLTTEGDITVNGATIELDGELVVQSDNEMVHVIVDVESGNVTIEV